MKLFGFFNRFSVPEEIVGATLVVGEAQLLQSAGGWLDAVAAQFGRIALASEDSVTGTPFAAVQLPEDKALPQFLEKAAPARVIVLGSWANAETLPKLTKAPCYWVNASPSADTRGFARVMVANHAAAASSSGAVLTGDPLLDQIAVHPAQTDSCERFKEQRDAGRWIGYFAGTGAGEEEIAYSTFNRLIRHKMGLMVLAPRDPARCEPVYRESIKYRLQTIRHNRLSTSFIPIKTRVYYVEAAEPLQALYGCVDFVVAGGTLDAQSDAAPDIVTPVRANRPVIVGPAGRDDPWVRAGIEAGMVAVADSREALFERAREIIEAPETAAQRAAGAAEWLALQAGARQRVLDLLR